MLRWEMPVTVNNHRNSHQNSHQNRHWQHGFTLFEVLVALAIVAVAMGAALRSAALAADSAVTLRQHTLAIWVAENRLALHHALNDWPLASATGIERQADSDFVWKETVSTTPMPMFRQIQIDVADAASPQHRLYRLVDFYLLRPSS